MSGRKDLCPLCGTACIVPKKVSGRGRIILSVSVAAVVIFVGVIGAYHWTKTPKPGKPAISGLREKDLVHEPPDVWNKVIVALREKDAPDKTATLILKAARDSNGVVSPQAKVAMAQASRAVAASLIEAISKMHKLKARKMVQTVWGSMGQGAVPALTDALKKKELQRYAAEALGQIGPRARDAVPALFETLRNDEGSWSLTRYNINMAVPKIGGDFVTLGRYLDDRNRDVCSLAITTLGKMGASAKTMVPKLAEKLADESMMIRCEAARALGEIGPAAEPAIPALLRALKDRSVGFLPGITLKFGDGPEERVTFSVARDAAEALGQIGLSTPSVVSALEEAIQKGDKKLRKAAQTALNKIQGIRISP